MHYNKLLIIVFLIILLFSGCQNQKTQEYTKLKNTANSLEERLQEIQNEIILISSSYTEIINSELSSSQLADIQKKYEYTENGIFFNPIYDNTSSGVLTGYNKINSSLKEKLFKSELINEKFINAYNNFSEIDQVYLITNKGMLRIYPGINVLENITPGLDFSEYKFYFLSDKKNNSGRELVWVNKPYLDPAGRSWVITLFFPVYNDDEMLGSIGMDLMISNLKNKYIEKNMFLVNDKGELLIVDDNIKKIFRLESIDNAVYYENIMCEKTLGKKYNMLNNKSSSIRKLFNQIEKNNGKIFHYKLDKRYMVISEKINTIDSYLVKLKPIN